MEYTHVLHFIGIFIEGNVIFAFYHYIAGRSAISLLADFRKGKRTREKRTGERERERERERETETDR